MASTSITFDILARDRASGAFSRVGSAAQSGSGRLSRLGDTFRKVGKAGAFAAVAAGAFAVKFGYDAVQASSDLNESMSKTKVIFKGASSAIDEMASNAATQLGQTKQQVYDAASTFGVFGKSAGLTGPKLGKFSTDLVGLTSDMASFSNTTPEEAIEAVGAALRGESEPIRKYGVLLDDATLRQQALKMGLIDTTKQALTPQQKVLAAQAQIFKQTTDAQGDFQRTSGGLANQQKILAANFDNVKISLGQKLLPVAIKFVTWINESIPKIQKLKEWLGDKLGPVFAKVGDWVQTRLLPALKKLGEDVLPSVKKFMGDVQQAFKSAMPFFKDVGDFTVSVLLPAFGDLAKHALPIIGQALKNVGKSLTKLADALRWLWNNAWLPIMKLMSKAVALVINNLYLLFRALASIPKAPEWVKQTASELGNAANEAKRFGDNLHKIPKRVSTEIHTTFTYSGLRQGTPANPTGVGPTRGSDGHDIGGPAHRSGRTVSQRGSGRMASSSGGMVSVSDLQAALSGMVLQVKGLDPGQEAYLQVGGVF